MVSSAQDCDTAPTGATLHLGRARPRLGCVSRCIVSVTCSGLIRACLPLKISKKMSGESPPGDGGQVPRTCFLLWSLKMFIQGGSSLGNVG